MNDSVKIINCFPSGDVRIPPSKSLGHRALICAALAGGEAEGAFVDNPGDSEDIRATRAGIAQIVDDCSNGRMIDCAESGSTLRFLLPVAAAAGGDWIFTGRGRLPERPLDAYERLFPGHGVAMERRPEGIRISGKLRAGTFALPGDVSSQFVTGLLLALPLLAEDSEIVLTSPLESADYVALTLDVMRAFGVQAREREGRAASADETCGQTAGAAGAYEIPGGQRYRPARYSVEGDWSQAAFFLCAGALGRPVSVLGLREDSAQGDRRVAGILRRMGIEVGHTPDRFWAASPEDGFHGTVIDARDIPDIVPPLAALACYAKGETRFENAGRLRLKESDRLSALAQELSRLGADAREESDALVIRGVGDGKSRFGAGLPGGEANARGDHRIAMAIAVAAIGCRNAVYLTGAECVRKSYPGFWQDFEKESKD